MDAPARVLTMVERRVDAGQRSAYLAELAARRAMATVVGAHVWAFEQLGEPGRLVEFTEAKREVDIAAVHDGALPAPLWREVRET